jgi:hypothetical protein
MHRCGNRVIRTHGYVVRRPAADKTKNAGRKNAQRLFHLALITTWFRERNCHADDYEHINIFTSAIKSETFSSVIDQAHMIR